MKNNLFLSSNNFKLFLYIILFWSLSVAQPLMTIFGNQAEFLIAHEVHDWNFIFLTLMLNIGIPMFLWVLLVSIGYVSTILKEWLSRTLILILLILLILPTVNTFSNNLAYLTALSISILLLYLLVKLEIIKTFALWLSPLSLVLMVSFLFFSSAKELLPSNTNENYVIKSNDNTPVFIFLFDEFPLLSLLDEKDKINKTRFPNISKLIKESTWYNQATTISSATDMAIPAILSGLKPNSSENRLATYSQYKQNLFSLLSSTHHLNVIENTSRMCPKSLCKPLIKDPIKLLVEDVLVIYAHYIFPEKKRKKLPPINDRWVGFLRELKNENKKLYTFSNRLNRFNEFVESFEIFQRNTLHFLHILLPHAPWRLLPDESLYAFYESEGVAGTMPKHDSNANFMHQWFDDKWATELSWRRQLLQIGAVDSLLGKAISKIKKLGLYEESTIIILADHGGAFIPNLSRRFAHDENIADIAAIPLIIKYPNQKQGKIDNRFASNIDILPTLLDLFSIKNKEQIDGLSLLDNKIRTKPTPIYQEGSEITELPENYQGLIQKHLRETNSVLLKNGWNSVYNTIDSDAIKNKGVDALQINKTIKDALILQHENLYTQIRSESKYIPAYYRVQSLIEEDISEILVAVNGQLVSHCYMFKHSPKECAGLINPSVYKSINSKEFVFRFFSVISKENGNYVVNELLTNKSSGAVITNDNGIETINYSTGNTVPILVTQPYGSLITRLVDNNTVYQIGGWAGNTETGQPAEKIYVFVDNELFTTTQTGLKKPYLYDTFGLKPLIDSGFEITIPVDQFPQLEKHKIRVFASIGSELSELNYNHSKKHKDLFKAFNPKTNRKIPVNKTAALIKKAKNLEGTNFTEIDAFSEVFKELSSGDWYSINNHTRWIGSGAEVVIPLMDNVKNLSVAITAKPLIFPGVLDKQTLFVYANDELVKTIDFEELSSHDVLIEVSDEDKNKPLVLKLKMPQSASPSDFSDSQDKRKLSLFLTDFKIRASNKED